MRKFLVLILIILAVAAAFPFWLPKLGTFLLVPDNLQRADSIVVLRGHDFYKMQKAVELFKKQYSRTIVVAPVREREEELWNSYYFRDLVLGTEPVSSSEFVLKAFKHLGLEDSGSIIVLEEETTSTYEEAVLSRKWLEQHDQKSIILIADTFHMRRALMLFKKVFKSSGIEIYPVTAVNPVYSPDGWWRRERDVRKVSEEYLSIIFNYLYHFVLKQHSTDFDS